SNNVSGGLLRVSVFNTTATMNPTVSAFVTGGAQITAGGTLTIDATANEPPAPVSDGTFDASGDVNGASNTISFRCNGTPCNHNAATGDVVTYDSRRRVAIAGHSPAAPSIRVRA